MWKWNIEEAEEEVEREFLDTNAEGDSHDVAVPAAQGRTNRTATHN